MPIVMHSDGTKTESFKNEGERALHYIMCEQFCDNKKQLERYVHKCENLVFDFIKHTFPSIFQKRASQEELSQWPAIITLPDFFKTMFKIYFLTFSISEDGGDWSENWSEFRKGHSFVDSFFPTYQFEHLLHALGKFGTAMIMNILFDEKVFIALDEHHVVNNDSFAFNQIAQFSFRTACQDFVARKAYENNKVEQSAKYTLLPQTNSDYAFLIRDTSARIFTELALIVNQSTADSMSEAIKKMSEKMATEEFKSMEQSLAEATKECATLKESLSNAEMKNRHLTEQLAASRNNINSIAEDNAEYVNALLRKIAKLEKRIDELTPEVTVETANDVVEHSQINTHEVDMNLNYLFVFGDEAPGQQQIIDAFPNAMIYNNQNINNAKIDMVVFMTAFLPHSRCNTVKNYCQRKDIPFIYCGVSNVECVKEIIWNAIND